MPSSSSRGEAFIKSWLPKIEPRTRILDVGAGRGKILRRYREPGQHWTGIEIFAPYIRKFRLKEHYDKIIHADARTYGYGIDTFDLAFAGDVLEHMTEEEARLLLMRLLVAAPVVIVAMPMGYYPQGTCYGNVHETHVTNHWTPEKVAEAFGPYVDHAWTPPVATFIYRRNP